MERREKFIKKSQGERRRGRRKGRKKKRRKEGRGGEEKLSIMGYILLAMYHLLRAMFNTLKLTNSFNSENWRQFYGTGIISFYRRGYWISERLQDLPHTRASNWPRGKTRISALQLALLSLFHIPILPGSFPGKNNQAKLKPCFDF